MFESADQESIGSLDEDKVIKLVKELNTGLATVKVKQKLKVKIYYYRTIRCFIIDVLS